jgi:RNA polymerase sigma factor (sigma-70 family)
MIPAYRSQTSRYSVREGGALKPAAQPAISKGRPTPRSRKAPISVLVAENNTVMRDVITLACTRSRHIRLFSGDGDGSDIPQLCATLHPDVLLLGANGPETFRIVQRLNDGGVRPPTILVSGHDADETIYRARILGIEAFLEHATLGQDVPETIERVARGEIVYKGAQERKALKHMASVIERARMRQRALALLTPKELQVLRLLVAGLGNRQCARRIGISESTIESHVRKIYRKLETRTRMEAVTKAVMLGIVDEDPPK